MRGAGFTTRKGTHSHSPPAGAGATARSERNRAGRRWLAVIVRHDLVYPLRSTISPPSDFLKT